LPHRTGPATATDFYNYDFDDNPRVDTPPEQESAEERDARWQADLELVCASRGAPVRGELARELREFIGGPLERLAVHVYNRLQKIEDERGTKKR
jgi:hypothetical protein